MVGAGPQAASSGAGERGAGALPGWRTGCDGVAWRTGFAWCVRVACRGVVAVGPVAGLGRSYVRSGAVGRATPWCVAGTVSRCGGAAFAWRACRINGLVEGSGVDGAAFSPSGATIGSTTGVRVSPMGSVTGDRASVTGSI